MIGFLLLQINFFFSRILYKWDYVMHTLLGLASFSLDT